VEGSNLQTEVRWGSGDTTKIEMLAKDLVGLRPDLILGHTTQAIAALAHETHTIPIVFPTVVDPVGSGFVASLSHPGRNITGFQSYDPEIGGKWFNC
jgi:putative tryptophan/tyrosine transport system substrate-binding protein